MKISDEELQETINQLPDIVIENPKDFAAIVMAVEGLKELQQLRKELNWLPIEELSEESAPQFFQVRDKGHVNSMPFWLMGGCLCTWAEDQDGIGDVSIEMAQEWYTHFRPLPMDLPEEEGENQQNELSGYYPSKEKYFLRNK